MKSAVFALALAALARAEDGPGLNPHLGEILDAMPDNLVAAMSYFPSSFINGLMDGSVWLPTEASDLLEKATGIPSDEVAAISSDYAGFISEISSLLPTPTDDQKESGKDATESSSAESETGASENSTGATEETSGEETTGSSEEDAEESSEGSEEAGDDETTEEDADDDTSGAAHVVRSFGLVAAVVASAALF
ncbi:hypothetical protein H4R20_002087 [Coemansia guatemalensis]|uniref:Uncharacterized protein n=1 Tax=Coemansia guatemalensis TaxID=2761395 RepID=A0A9W8HW52_9FUNG|nr:hypothetical protein H4R20_002087 [Coemansia guatemalensis]